MKQLLLLARAAFFSALMFTGWAAFSPPGTHGIEWVPWDKAQHFIAFYALTGLAVAAFPRVSIYLIAILLSAFGALIEVVQGLPIVHRDQDVGDWIADSVAISCALAPLYLVWWRGVWRDQKNSDR